ncbi:uncharacterized protein LOC122373815 [Amphibalanus amphitrite]|uniref:uncharacterized protein LOC122373815 n=2 Tax=Amphibalanus amphitrite TaxID=1232801 RepID=UPI001C92A943|nr:uncharacterized protein LOC122373815 [Amphibalanus amphitrite]
MPRYCAVANCRSGHKPTIWDRENNKPTPRLSVFRFPGNKASKRKWAEAIGRNVENLNGVNCGICEKHFRPHDFRAGANRRGKDRKRRLLKKDAVPFVELATGRSTPRPTKFADPSARRLRQEQEAENRTQAFFADDQIQNLADLCQKLKKEHLPVGFRVAEVNVEDVTVISIRKEEVREPAGMPVITHNITIYDDLRFKLHCQGTDVSVKTVSDICCVPGAFSSVSEVLNVIARLKSVTVTVAARLSAATTLLDTIAESSDGDVCPVVSFCAEQLRLVAKPANNRRCSQELLGNAVIWERMSPKLYSTLQQSPLLCIPHSKTLRRLTSALQVSAGLDSTTMAYLRMRVEKLAPRERLINMAMDEVYCAQTMELAGGRLFGEQDGAIAKTLFCVHVNSVAGTYQDMICMQPVPHVKTSDINDIFNKTLKGLTELGLTVVSVTTDNHRTNQAWHRSLGTDGHHPEYLINPYSDDEKIFTLYDTVHVFKNLYYGMMRNKSLRLPPLPGSEDQRDLEVSFDHRGSMRWSMATRPSLRTSLRTES